MNYDTIILEMLSRIQTLEQQIKHLTDEQEQHKSQTNSVNTAKQIGTKEIGAYIQSLKQSAYENNETFLVLKANDIHKYLKLKNRMPLVCNAMKQCMKSGDEVVHETPSGYSSTLEIKYHFKEGVFL